jgi:hypothetical protein
VRIISVDFEINTKKLSGHLFVYLLTFIWELSLILTEEIPDNNINLPFSWMSVSILGLNLFYIKSVSCFQKYDSLNNIIGYKYYYLLFQSSALLI